MWEEGNVGGVRRGTGGRRRSSVPDRGRVGVKEPDVGRHQFGRCLSLPPPRFFLLFRVEGSHQLFLDVLSSAVYSVS